MKKRFLTFLLGLMTTLALSAQGGVTEVGATNPNSEASTTYGTEETYDPQDWVEEGGGSGTDAGNQDPNSPIGAPWILLGFAAAYVGYRLVRRKGVGE